MSGINYLAVVVAGASAFCLGGLWYSPKMFLNAWLKASNIPEKKDGHGPKTFAFAFIFSVIAALGMAYFLEGETSLSMALVKSLIVGVGFAGSSIAINFLFSGRSWTLICIDGGYHVFQFLIYGLILGLWR